MNSLRAFQYHQKYPRFMTTKRNWIQMTQITSTRKKLITIGYIGAATCVFPYV